VNQLPAGVIILYNPDEKVIHNIKTYRDVVDTLFVIDNSDTADQDQVAELANTSKVDYIKMPHNMGISAALNIACKKAIDNGFKWILTMDQDSSASTEMVENLLVYTTYDNIAIISPYHANKYAPLPDTDEKFSELTTAMTSGNLLNLDLYQIIGPFDESLFIDFVDHDYCLRARRLGYKVIQVNDAVLKHNLGNLRQHRFFTTILYSTNHPPIRKYYIFRNRAFIVQKYKHDFPDFCKREFRRFFTDVLVVVCFERDKVKKLKMMYKGLRDFFHGKTGAYES